MSDCRSAPGLDFAAESSSQEEQHDGVVVKFMKVNGVEETGQKKAAEIGRNY